MKNHAGLDYGFEPQLLYFDAIPAGREIGHIVRSCLIGQTLVVNPRTGVNDGNCCFGDHRLLWVSDAAGEGSIGGLSAKRDGKQQAKQHN